MSKFKNLAIISNIIFAISIIICDILFICNVIDIYIIKTLTSALFVLMGIFNLVLVFICDGKFKFKSIVMLLGLVFAFIGDVVLIDNFILGAIFFAIGHIFFLAYFILLSKLTFIDALVALALIIFAVCLILLYPNFDFDGMQVLVMVYAFVISLMLAKAIGNFITRKTLATLVLMIGAFLFFFSDLMLLFYVFSTSGAIVFDYLCLASYYPAEILLALSILMVAFDRKLKIKEEKIDE